MRLLSIILHPIIDSTTSKISHFIKHFFSARVVNTWNSLTNSVVDACTVSAFKARLDKFWQQRAKVWFHSRSDTYQKAIRRSHKVMFVKDSKITSTQT